MTKFKSNYFKREALRLRRQVQPPECWQFKSYPLPVVPLGKTLDPKLPQSELSVEIRPKRLSGYNTD